VGMNVAGEKADAGDGDGVMLALSGGGSANELDGAGCHDH